MARGRSQMQAMRSRWGPVFWQASGRVAGSRCGSRAKFWPLPQGAFTVRLSLRYLAGCSGRLTYSYLRPHFRFKTSGVLCSCAESR